MNAKLENGRCLCGKVSYSFNQSDAISAHHCHCKDCQKITGSGKATILLVPSNSLKIEGDLKFFTVSGTAGSSVSRGFCKECGSITDIELNSDLESALEKEVAKIEKYRSISIDSHSLELFGTCDDCAK